MRVRAVSTFESWRKTARELLAKSVTPSSVQFFEEGQQRHLFNEPEIAADASTRNYKPAAIARVPRRFLEFARWAFCHRDPTRFELLYRMLWRLTHNEPELLEIATDDDVHRLQSLVKAVKRDAHKMKAFVRFRRVAIDGDEHYVAWHRPDHRIVRLVAPFFARRFPNMHWTILTPNESVCWDGRRLHFGPGADSTVAPRSDELEELWKTYYASVFNPSRIKLHAMKREMPVRHWKTLPETVVIPELLADASRRVSEMLHRQADFGRSAANYLPTVRSIESLRAAAPHCRGCELYCHATQTVFGDGPASASIMVVGEQPGDLEDIAGRPFVGPAGQVFDEAMQVAGLNRDDVYLTNAVKHFKFVPRGKRRIHKKPSAREVIACRPWLEEEIALVKPKVLICLGSTAAQVLLGSNFRITRQRGDFFQTSWCAATMATYHPSAVLRAVDRLHRDAVWNALVSDLTRAAHRIRNDDRCT
jgi:DNA polymerase